MANRADELTGRLLTRCTFPSAGERVVCAVSGGPDSAALLVLATAAGLHVEAVHVDHGLRENSDREADVVESLAQRFGASFRSERVHVADGPDLEARCRMARRGAVGPGALYGHTMDDQAETVLWHLVRGSGLRGVSGIHPAAGHPMLGVRRSETVELCEAHGIRPVSDPTNVDPRFTRNRFRHEVIPLLDDVADRDVVPLLARFADHARADDALLEEMAADLDATDAKALAAAPRTVAARAVRQWLTPQFGDGHPPSSGAVDRVLAVAEGLSVAADVERGKRVERHAQRLSVVAVGTKPQVPE